MEIIWYIVVFVLGVLGGAVGGVASGGVHIDNSSRSDSSSYAIANQGQATIVEGGQIRGLRMVVTNIRGSLPDALGELSEWQRREARFARDLDGWVLVYPEYAWQARTNVTRLEIVNSNGNSWTNRTNY